MSKSMNWRFNDVISAYIFNDHVIDLLRGEKRGDLCILGRV